MSVTDSTTSLEVRPIPGFPGYYAREDGVIFSRKLVGSPIGTLVPLSQAKILRARTDGGTGYMKINFTINNQTVSRRVHTLVLLTFVGPAPEGMECRHLDSNKFNNHVSNLQWATRSDNMQDRISVGTSNRGEKSAMAKLTVAAVKEIRNRRIDGETYHRIANHMGVSRESVRKAILGKTWGWITDDDGKIPDVVFATRRTGTKKIMPTASG